MSYKNSADFARQTGEALRLLRGSIRRMAITLTESAIWRVIGRQGNEPETIDSEQFGGVGFYARPPASGKPEAVVVAVGGAATTAIVATRDEATRAASVGNLAAGETAVYNDKAVIVVKADGSVEIRLVGGAAVPLALKSDLDALRAVFAAWVPVATDGGLALKTAVLAAAPAGWHPVGTTVLKGQ